MTPLRPLRLLTLASVIALLTSCAARLQEEQRDAMGGASATTATTPHQSTTPSPAGGSTATTPPATAGGSVAVPTPEVVDTDEASTVTYDSNLETPASLFGVSVEITQDQITTLRIALPTTAQETLGCGGSQYSLNLTADGTNHDVVVFALSLRNDTKGQVKFVNNAGSEITLPANIDLTVGPLSADRTSLYVSGTFSASGDGYFVSGSVSAIFDYVVLLC